ncbi:MAG: DUF5060 domain-containing protein [Sedimentisphaerales bacterium]
MKKLILIVFATLLCSNLLAVMDSNSKIEKWGFYELSLPGPSKGNPFIDIEFSAVFKQDDRTFEPNGFYDGNGIFKIRFMPDKEGIWTYKTKSNREELNGKEGQFECIAPSKDNHGPVRVANTFYFAYADGKPYYPFGTTAYAWTHMSQEIQEMTLNTLKNSGFNKVRMCVFPKNHDLVKEEPEIYPFPMEVKKDSSGKDIKVWDFNQFNPAFFQHLEKRINDLSRLGIEADLILFHPYDKGRWGFDAMSNEVNIRYIKYLTARLSSFRNVWWSMANEFDLVKAKSHDDWDLLSKTVVASDPYRHLCSIHGSTARYYEYWKPEFTHVSVQDEAPVMNFGAAAILRNAYSKPIIYDEVGYEGNLKQRWGWYSPEEMTYLVWMGVIGGTYVTHGEAYMFKDNTDIIFWAKGGEFKGTSWKRIAFLRKIVEECPNPLQMADVSRDNYTSTAGSGYYIIYFGKEMNESWLFNLPIRNGRNASKAANYKKPVQGTRFKVEIIDTWDMTIQTCPLTFETTKEIDYRVYDKDFQKVRLPLKPYIALRITEIPQ